MQVLRVILTRKMRRLILSLKLQVPKLILLLFLPKMLVPQLIRLLLLPKMLLSYFLFMFLTIYLSFEGFGQYQSLA